MSNELFLMVLMTARCVEMEIVVDGSKMMLNSVDLILDSVDLILNSVDLILNSS
jgi:hypothetical protein